MAKRKIIWMLADIKKEIYDPHVFTSFEDAVHINLAGQLSDEEKFHYVVPLSKTRIKQLKFKRSKLL